MHHSRRTLSVALDIREHNEFLVYQPGDHVAIYPANPQHLVDRVLQVMQLTLPADELVRLEVHQERMTPLGMSFALNLYEFCMEFNFNFPQHANIKHKVKIKYFYFTTVTAKLEACMLAIDLSGSPPAMLVPTYTARCMNRNM